LAADGLAVCSDGAVSLRDPSLTRPRRVIFAAMIYSAAVAASVLAGLGWWNISRPVTAAQVSDGPFAEVFIGMSGGIVLLIATGFALPPRWRASSVAGPLMLALAGVELIAAGVGMAVGRAFSRGSPLAVIVIAGLGLALILRAALTRVRSVSRAAARDEMVRTGLHVAGLVADREQTAMVNNVPRWRVVVRFADASGTTRWVTKHSTTRSPPSVGQPVDVYFDPSRPDRQRDIVVSW
jgi:hypothetical protein